MKLRRPPFATYSPGRKDARIGEAIAFARGARHLRNLDCYALSNQFNLKISSAETILVKEHERRRADATSRP